MSISDLAWLKYPLATIALLAFITVLGLAILIPVRRSLPKWSVLLAPHIGMAWAVILVSWYARLGVALHWWVVYGVAVLALATIIVDQVRAGGFPAVRQRLTASSAGSVARQAFEFGVPWLIGVGLVTAFMLPVITSPLLQDGYVTSFTLGNADIGAYIGEATNMARAGFDNAGYYFQWNPGSDPSTMSADVDHTGANALLALGSVVLGAPVWKVAQIVLMLSCAALFAAGVALVREILPQSFRTAIVIAGFGCASVMVWYLAGNYFLAQLVCMGLILAQLAVIAGARDRLLDWRIVATVAPLMAATWLSTPEVGLVGLMLIVAFVGTSFAARFVKQRQLPLGEVLKSATGIAASVGIAVLLAFPFMADSIARSQRVYDVNGIVGWALDLQNVLLLMLGSTDPIGSTSAGLGAIVAIALSLVLIAFLIRAFARNDEIGVLAGLFGLVLVAVGAYGAQRWGWVTYQSWKLTITLSVPFLIVAGVLVLRSLSEPSRTAAVAVIACLVSVNVVAGARMWHPARVDPPTLNALSIPNKLVTFLGSSEVQRQGRLNIYLPTWHETMIAPAVYRKRGAMSSPSYYSSGHAGPHPYSCSLVDRRLYKRRMGKIVHEAHDYLLVATPVCR